MFVHNGNQPIKALTAVILPSSEIKVAEQAEALNRLGGRVSKYTALRKAGLGHEAALNEAVKP